MTGKPKLLALASGGGHWVQLQRLRPAFADFEIVYVSMFESYAEQVVGSRYYVVPDASRFDIKSFHRAILDGGALPLSVLDGKLTRWIDRQRAR